ncbi:MAG: hypothetical protein WKF43_01195 [Acidimicrobiales bacterium]
MPPAHPTTPVIDPGDGGDYQPDVTASDFVDGIDNPYMPWIVGSRWVYEGTSDGEPERVEVAVLDKTKKVMGVAATVVHDTVYVNDELVEDTYDWFAQDREGNVWYLGEAVEDLEDGKVVSTEGSWEAGVDGAQPGIVMPAAPAKGDVFRQEFLEDTAEDMAEIIATGGSATVSAGTYDGVIKTRDWTPLEPEVIEEKSYAPAVGFIAEVHTAGGTGSIELVSFTPGP